MVLTAHKITHHYVAYGAVAFVLCPFCLSHLGSADEVTTSLQQKQAVCCAVKQCRSTPFNIEKICAVILSAVPVASSSPACARGEGGAKKTLRKTPLFFRSPRRTTESTACFRTGRSFFLWHIFLAFPEREAENALKGASIARAGSFSNQQYHRFGEIWYRRGEVLLGSLRHTP